MYPSPIVKRLPQLVRTLAPALALGAMLLSAAVASASPAADAAPATSSTTTTQAPATTTTTLPAALLALQAAGPITCGDVDCSANVRAPDALRVLRVAVGQNLVVTCSIECDEHEDETTPRTFPPLACADMNCDGRVTAADALAILKLAVGQSIETLCGFECHGSVCGDGEVCDEGWNCISGPDGGPEQCDDGNLVDDDACTNACTLNISPCNDLFDDPSPDPAPRSVTADAGGDREALRGSAVELAGSSTAPDGAEVELCWTLESRPAGSTAELDDRASATPTFVADEPGDYVLVLRAATETVVSHPSRITVTSRFVRTEVEADEGEFLVSADHALTMNIPAGALAADTEISIELLRTEDLPAELAEAGVAAAYEFGPDGTPFSSPVDLHWKGGLDPDNAPIVPVSADEDFTDADGARTFLSADGVEATWQTDHFSRFAALRLRSIVLHVDGPLLAGVGHRFEIGYSVSSLFAPAGFTAVTRRVGAFADAPQLLPPLPVDPVVEDLRYDRDVDLLVPNQTGSSGVVSGRCVDVGVVRVAFEVELSASSIRALLPSGSFTRDPVVQLSATVRCVAGALAPVAVDDNIAIGFPAGALTVSPLGNDFDPDGQLDPATIEIVQQPARGSAVANADGTVSVTLGGKARLADSFRYRVSDNDGIVSNVATVTLRRFDLPNVPPVLNDDAFLVGRNTPASLAVLANDTDSDGVLDPGSVQVTQIPMHGSATVNPDGSVFYEPNLDFLGADSFRYQATDERGAFGPSALVTIQVVTTSPPPVANDDDAATLLDERIDIDVLANDSGNIDATTLQITSDPIQGSAEVIQPASGDPVIRFTPAPGFLGQDFFQYRVANPDGDFSPSAFVRIFVSDPNNLPPVAEDDFAETPINTAVDIFVTANDFDPDGLLVVGSEEIVSPPLHGTAERGGFGVFRYTPDTDFLGTDTFTYRVADAQGAWSNVALVTVEVFDPPNIAPVAGDDSFVVSPGVAALLPVLLNDSDEDGTIDPTSVTVTQAPSHGTAVPQADGRVQYTSEVAFIGDDSFQYRVADNLGQLSNEATVTVQVRDFAGTDGNPVDNISAAQVHFFANFVGDFVDQGIGGFYGFNHADADALGKLTPISDYTWWFEGNPDTGDPGIASSFSMETDLQSGVATYDAMAKIHRITGFVPGAIFPDGGGTFAVEPTGGGTRSQVSAPPTLLDGQGNPTIFRGEFDRFRTVVQFPDGQFTHMLLRAIEFRPPSTLQGVLMRVPAEEMELDPMTGMRFRPILDDLAATTVDSLGFEPTGGIAVVFYNQVDNSAYFTGEGKRTVPLAAGRGVSLPAAQMSAPRQPCASRPTGVECAAGPREVLMAVNQNGTVTMHSPEDGSQIGTFLGENAPNFTIDQGWHLVQDPATNCLYFSDSGNRKIAKYNTTGSLIASTFITTAGGASNVLTPRGLAFSNTGELLVADTPLGRILRYNNAGTFLGELATGLGAPNGLFVLGNGDVLYSDESQPSTTDRVSLVPADGGDVRHVIGTGLATPYQISRMFDGSLALAVFGTNRIRLFEDGFPNIAERLIGTNPQFGGNMNPRGIWPLRNGNWLAALSNGGGVAILDPEQEGTAYVETIAAGNTFRFISSVCLPEQE